ncbi:hypothetical protein [Amycolatopsis sp. NPDC051061]|uniref:hypothetical protein n=1 Tax=Amycolatopsis sp. NPDC051061 TaxID=3155042 RepID=UPI0034326721
MRVALDLPGHLLARLALNRSLHGQDLGTDLLLDAIGRIVGVADLAAGRLLAVDALDDIQPPSIANMTSPRSRATRLAC